MLRKVLAGRQIAAGERYEAVLHAAAMTAALGLELLEPKLDLARLPQQYERAVASVKTGTARLALHTWREVSSATLGEELDLSGLRSEDFVGV